MLHVFMIILARTKIILLYSLNIQWPQEAFDFVCIWNNKNEYDMLYCADLTGFMV